MIKQQLQDDVKSAMLAGESLRVETLRGLKSAIQYAEVASKQREGDGLPDEEILNLFARESKKRAESAALYVQGGATERAEKELAEKAIIDTYLPAQLSEAEIVAIIDTFITEHSAEGMGAMGKVIGAVKAQTGNSADGSLIARLVKERLSQ